MTENDTPGWKRTLDALPSARACGDCELCCTVLHIDELNKRAGARCGHQTGGGCAIWGGHPPSCKAYVCLWRGSDRLLPPGMFPLDCGFVLSVNRPDAWPAMITLLEAPGGRALAWSRTPHVEVIRRLAADWNCPVAVVDYDGRANQVFTPAGRYFARRTRPDLFSDDGRALALPESEYGSDRRSWRERLLDAGIR